MEFVINGKLNYDDVYTWNNLYVKQNGKLKTVLLWLIVLSFIVCVFNISYLDFRFYGTDAATWITIVMGFIVLLVVAFRVRISAYFSYKRLMKLDMGAYFRVNEQGILFNNRKTEGMHYFAAVEDIWRDDKRVYLIISEKAAAVIPFGGMEQGTPEDLISFLEEKTGKKAKQI